MQLSELIIVLLFSMPFVMEYRTRSTHTPLQCYPWETAKNNDSDNHLHEDEDINQLTHCTAKIYRHNGRICQHQHQSRLGRSRGHLLANSRLSRVTTPSLGRRDWLTLRRPCTALRIKEDVIRSQRLDNISC
ncbi:unnamed protein product [Nezara viridula]|uniref:Neuropeptide n=1 Tax=Nezara viridula TaxID=85310 RepID=A0A9P0H252_NEZVI|nr:unnamed protein product [Nezara viridula]